MASDIPAGDGKNDNPFLQCTQSRADESVNYIKSISQYTFSLRKKVGCASFNFSSICNYCICSRPEENTKNIFGCKDVASWILIRHNNQTDRDKNVVCNWMSHSHPKRVQPLLAGRDQSDYILKFDFEF